MTKPPRDRISAVAILARNAGFPDVAAWLMARDKETARKPRKQTAKRAHITRNGVRVRGGRAFVNLSNPDVEIVENIDGRLDW